MIYGSLLINGPKTWSRAELIRAFRELHIAQTRGISTPVDLDYICAEIGQMETRSADGSP